MIENNCFDSLTLLYYLYRVRDCGMNFEWDLFEFTNRDCSLLAKVNYLSISCIWYANPFRVVV